MCVCVLNVVCANKRVSFHRKEKGYPSTAHRPDRLLVSIWHTAQGDSCGMWIPKVFVCEKLLTPNPKYGELPVLWLRV